MLGSLDHKWFQIGIQLGIPRNVLEKFEGVKDPLSAIIDFWLEGNVQDKDAPVTWATLAAALKSSHVGAPAIAKRIMNKYCPSHSSIDEECK